MKRPSSRSCFYSFCSAVLAYLCISGLVVHLGKHGGGLEEILEDRAWIASSKSWLDRQLCRWAGVCGIQHYIYKSRWTWSHAENDVHADEQEDVTNWWRSGDEDPDSWSKEEVKLREVPQYVLDHAPYVHLFSGEQFWPGDLSEHLLHTAPYLNYSQILDLHDDQNLTNLKDLNDYNGGRHGRHMYLQSNDNVEERPKWLAGTENIPKVPDRNDDFNMDHPWPDFNDLKDVELETAQQTAFLSEGSSHVAPDIVPELPTNIVPSKDGRCGGSSGYTCKGSKFGHCCSIYGWCGSGGQYCGDICNPLSGNCHDPSNPPHRDLRRRTFDMHGRRHIPEPGGRSSAPAVLVVVPKEDGIVDAFWFFFYSYNLGQKVLNIRFGNHVGDWEHTAVRFRNGKPIQLFLSEHNFGEAFTWRAIEKYVPSYDGSGTMIGSWSNATAARHAKRPVIYSAVGSHAMYGTPGLHPYIIPFGLLHDETDRGPLWDPAQNVQAYTYDPKNQRVRASMLNPKSPTGWFHYAGHWGDKYYPLSDPRQYRFAGQYHYVNGPTGPKFKNLGRKKVCQGRSNNCHIRNWLGGRKSASHPPEEEDVEEGGLPGGNYTEA